MKMFGTDEAGLKSLKFQVPKNDAEPVPIRMRRARDRSTRVDRHTDGQIQDALLCSNETKS